MIWERAVCITLKGSERDFDFPFPVERFYGFDGRNGVDASLYDAERRRGYGRADMSPAEIGCAVSHREVARMVAQSEKITLVLEDDAMLVGEIPDHAPDFALAYLGYQEMNMSAPLRVRFKYPYYWLKGNLESVRRIYSRPLNTDWIRAGWFNGAYAYILTPLAARYIVELQERIWLEADTALSHFTRFGGEAIALRRPAFVARTDIPSSIGARESWH